MIRISFVACLLASIATTAHAEIERYAIIIGHNVGAADEQKLRYAESDAARVAELMSEIGGVRDENQVVLRGKTADQVRRALIALNERIRSDQRAGHDAMLFVYYSGHGDADALHLGDTRLELRELEALVRGSSAQIRILVIDSCRSGAVTRVKGGAPAPPIALSSVIEVPGEGIIVLTASTSGEDAQESDQLAGSFFTHYLLSALHGAADENNDQIVTVTEAFAHTRAQTILASSRSLAGTQHPTFYYDLRGRSEVALTDLGSDEGRGRLTLPAGATYLVMRGSLTGGVVGEIGANIKHRTLSLRPGTYAVRGRGRDALLEGLVEVVANRETVVDPDKLARTTYARLVRKGRGDILGHVSGLIVGSLVQTPIIVDASPCFGVLAGWSWVRSNLTVSPRLVGWRSMLPELNGIAGKSMPIVGKSIPRGPLNAVAIELHVAKAWDLRRVTIDLGVSAGGELLYGRLRDKLAPDLECQPECTLGPPKLKPAAYVGTGAGASISLRSRMFLGVELAAQTHFYYPNLLFGSAGSTTIGVSVVMRSMLAIGMWL
jgi:hypothetical protein